MSKHVQKWVREAARLTPDAIVQVVEEPHCPDPSCPLHRTVILWTDSAGRTNRVLVVKPLAYVRLPDIERALSLLAAKG